MNKPKNKLLPMILFALLAALVLTACQTETPATDAPPTDAPAPVAEDTATSAPPEETAPSEPTDFPEPPATATDAPTPTADAQGNAPVFESASCRFDEPFGFEVECGYVTVPENRDDPDTHLIRLHVAKFASTSSSPAPEPIIYLDGGPGGETLELISFIFEDRFAPLLANNDLIVFDQRGIGFSEPELACPEVIDLTYELLPQDISAEEATDQTLDAVAECHTRLMEEGIDVSGYNSAENAADVNDLRIALGYEQVNLFGVSYGTRLGLTIMRDFPEGVRSIVLDSSVPLQVNLDATVPSSADRAFTTLFEGCRNDETCNQTYPDLENVFFDTVDALDAEPAMIEVFHALNGTGYDVLLDGSGLVGFLFQSLYSSEIIPSLPGIIYDTSAGNFGRLAQVEGSFLVNNELISHGMHYSVQCNEDVLFNLPGEIADAADDFPQLAPMFEDGESVFELCALWDSGQSDAFENLAVESDLPALILAGEYDPITPPAWGRIVAETLPNSFFFEFPGLGHGPGLDGGCPQEIVLEFFGDPSSEPDSSCITEMAGPAFRVPLTEISLVPYTNDALGISSVVPEGWEEIAPGVFSEFDGVIAIIAVPGMDQVLLRDTMLRQLDLPGNPDSTGTSEAGAFTWTLYEVEITGIQVDLAVTENEWGAFLVLVQPPSGERDFYFENVFLPALEAFESVNQ